MKYKKNPCDTFVCIKLQFSRLFLLYVLIEVNAANWKTKYTLRFIISVIAFQVLIKSKAKKNISEEDKKSYFFWIHMYTWYTVHIQHHYLELPCPVSEKMYMQTSCKGAIFDQKCCHSPAWWDRRTSINSLHSATFWMGQRSTKEAQKLKGILDFGSCKVHWS